METGLEAILQTMLPYDKCLYTVLRRVWSILCIGLRACVMIGSRIKYIVATDVCFSFVILLLRSVLEII